MHLVAELLERKRTVAVSKLGGQIRQRLGQRRFAIIEPLEFKQRFQQAAPFAFAGANGEQRKESVVPSARDLHPPRIQESTKDGCRNSGLRELTARISARRENGHLGRVQQAIV